MRHTHPPPSVCRRFVLSTRSPFHAKARRRLHADEQHDPAGVGRCTVRRPAFHLRSSRQAFACLFLFLPPVFRRLQRMRTICRSHPGFFRRVLNPPVLCLRPCVPPATPAPDLIPQPFQPVSFLTAMQARHRFSMRKKSARFSADAPNDRYALSCTARNPAPQRADGFHAYFCASSTATATATVAPTMGLLPMPIRPIISTCAGTEEEPANCASECMRPMVSVMP